MPTVITEGMKVAAPLLKDAASKLLGAVSPLIQNLSVETAGQVLESSPELNEHTRNVFQTLQTFKQHLSGQVTTADHEFLQSVLDSHERGEQLSQSDLERLSALAKSVEGLPEGYEKDGNGQYSLFHLEPDPTKPATGEQAEAVQGPADSSPLGVLRTSIKSILRTEVMNKSGLFGLIAEAAKKAGWGDPESYIDDEILNDGFMARLEKSIRGENVNLEGLTDAQKRCFTVVRWGTRALDLLPSNLVSYLPMLAHALTWGTAIICHIPVIGKIYATAFPFLNEALSFLGRFNPQAQEIKAAIGRMKPATPQGSGSPQSVPV